MSGFTNFILQVKNSFAESLSNNPRTSFFVLFILGDVTQILINYKNLTEVNKLDNTNFVAKWKYFNSQNAPNISPQTYNDHRDTQQLKSLGTVINNLVGLCLKCAKFWSNYYNVIWQWTDGHGWSPTGRACAFACLDSLGDGTHEAITALFEVIWGSKAVQYWETLEWLLARPFIGLQQAVTCYLVAYFVGLSEPLVYLAIWMTLRIVATFDKWRRLMYEERLNSPLPDSMNIVTENSGYPKSRIVLVKTIAPASETHKSVGAKYCNYFFVNYIFVSYRLVSKITDDQERAAIVLREAGDWKMWWYSCSYLKLAYQLAFHFTVGFLALKAYGNSTVEEICRLDSGMHPVVTLWVSWQYMSHPIKSLLGLLAGCVEAQIEFRKDDYVCEVMKSNQKLFEALSKLTEIALESSSIYGNLYARRFMGEPTVWERMERMTKRYGPYHQPSNQQT